MLKITRAEILSAEVDDEPGGLARTLKAIADYGANLDCIVSRRCPDKPGKGVVFVSAPNRKKMYETPDQAGYHTLDRIPTLKVEGSDRPGLGAELTQIIGDTGVNMRGLTANKIGHKFACFIGFDSEEDRNTAETALSAYATHQSRWHRRLKGKITERERSAK